MAGELFDAARRLSRAQPVAKFRRRAGVVVSVQTAYRCTIRLAGDTTDIAGVRYFSHSAPRPGQQVWIDTDGLDTVVVGTIAGNGGAAPVCRVWRTANQTGVVSGTATAVTWQSSLDPWGMWTSGANVVLPLDGFYLLTATVAFEASSTGAYRTVDIIHATAVRGRTRYTGTMAGGTAPFVTTTTIVSGVRGDNVSVEGTSDQTGPYAFSQTAQFPFLAVQYVGPAS